MHLTDHVHVFHSFPQSMCLMDLDWWQCGFHAFSSGPISCETSLWFLWQTKNSTLPPARNQCGGVPYLFNRKTGKVQTPWAESNVQSNKGQSNFESARRCGDRSFCLFLPSLDWKTRSSQVDTHTQIQPTCQQLVCSMSKADDFPFQDQLIHPLCRMWSRSYVVWWPMISSGLGHRLECVPGLCELALLACQLFCKACPNLSALQTVVTS